MNSAEKEAVLHCLKSMIDEEVCEECPLYGMTGTDHCEKDCIRLAINALAQEPCTDAISREAVLKAIDAKAWEFCDYLISKGKNDEQKPVSHFADNLRECISEDLPSVTPAEKVGQWEWVRYDGNPNIGNWHCSECNRIVCGAITAVNPVYSYKYCPECGAKMQEVEE